MAGVLTVSPLADPADYDSATIAGIVVGRKASAENLRFVVEVNDAARPYAWDKKKAAGSQGQTITYRGWDLATPKLKFKFWTDAQITGFYTQLVPAITYDAEKEAPKPYDIYHPKLLANEIIWLVTEKIGDLIDEGAQLWTVTVETTEYRQAKAKNTTSTPNTANQNQNGKATKPTARDALDVEIDRLKNEWAKPD